METEGSLPHSPASYTCPSPVPNLQTDVGHNKYYTSFLVHQNVRT